MVQHGFVTIVYDGDGNRVSETVGGVTTNYLVDTQNPTGYAQVVEELQAGTVTRTYSYGLERINENQVLNSAWTPSFYGYDGHGSVRQLTNSAGAVTDTYDYDAFGNLINSTGTTPNNYLFAGEQYDPALGLYYNRARYLNTTTGRFWSMDSYEGDNQDPKSLHRYLYVGDDPTDSTDPAGLTPLTDFIAKLAARGVAITARVYGSLAHTAIEADIEAHYPLAFTEVPVAGGEIDVIIPAGEFAHLYEIKPVGGTVDPTKQISRYLAALGSTFAGLVVIPGTLSFDEDIRGPLLIERINYYTAGAGIIYYEPYLPNNNLTLSPVGIAVIATITLGVMVGIAALTNTLAPGID